MRSAIWTVVRLQATSSPALALAGVAYIAFTGLLPTATAIASGVLVGAVPGTVANGMASRDGRTLGAALAATVLLFVVGNGVYVPFVSTLSHLAGFRFGGTLRDRLMAALLAPTELTPLEDRQVADEVAVASRVARESHVPIGITESLLDYAAARLGGWVSVAVVARWRVAPAVALALAWMLLPRWIKRVTLAEIARMEGDTTALRRASYHLELSWTSAPAKEVRVFGLARWLNDRYTAAWGDGTAQLRTMRATRRFDALPVLCLAAVTTAVASALIARDAASGAISLAAAVVYLQSALGAQGVGTTQAWWWYSLQGAEWVRRLEGLPRTIAERSRTTIAERSRTSGSASTTLARTAERPSHAPGEGAPADGLPRSAIVFEGVAFAYPNGTPVLRGLDLDIPAGRSTAIVGLNGAGKTTIVKLLAGLYTPLDGRVLVDGADIASLDVESWRRRLAVIFQQFVRYELSVRDNVGFDLPQAGLDRAADAAGAAHVVASLPHGWDTVLGAGYRSASELSGGQWQRIALARALAAVGRGAGVLVLDEPTANLDVRAEADLFDRFLGVTRGLTTVLISHRFSTVRRADRICVLEDGRITESGSHDGLLAARGAYARMFSLQAARYREDHS